MKKIVIIVFIAMVLFAGYLFLQKDVPIPLESQQQTISRAETTQTTPSLFGQPSRLKIPALGVDVVIEEVGMDEKGNMDVPRDPNNAAWYTLGHKIGSNGSAVIAAHYDLPSGDPAVFYRLSSLTQGDTIEVEDGDGTTLTYEVEESGMYPFNDFPLQRVFNTTGIARLNLITCDGAWNSSEGTYSSRLVVYTKLANSE